MWGNRVIVLISSAKLLTYFMAKRCYLQILAKTGTRPQKWCKRRPVVMVYKTIILTATNQRAVLSEITLVWRKDTNTEC